MPNPRGSGTKPSNSFLGGATSYAFRPRTSRRSNMTTNSYDKTKRKKTTAAAEPEKIDAQNTTHETGETEPALEYIEIKRTPAVKFQPSIFDPLQETLNLKPEQKEKYRTRLRTIDTGAYWGMKQSLSLMTFNFFSFSKEPKMEIQEIVALNSKLTITPSIHGAPTMYDADILMFAVSALAEDIRRNKSELTRAGTMPYKGDVVFQLKDFSERIGRTRNSRKIEQITEALDRLSNCLISIEKTEMFGGTEIRVTKSIGSFLNGYKFCEISESGKKPVAAVQVRIADWIVRAIAQEKTLTIPDEYFALSPVEKSIFMVARSLDGMRTLMIQKGGKELFFTSKDHNFEPGADGPGTAFEQMMNSLFFHRITLLDLAERMNYRQPLRKLKFLLLEIIRKGGFTWYGIALDDRKRALTQNVVYFFRNDEGQRKER